MDSRRTAKGAELSTAAVVAYDEPADAVGNSGRTRDFILCNLGQLGQQVFADLLGREPEVLPEFETALYQQHHGGGVLRGLPGGCFARAWQA